MSPTPPSLPLLAGWRYVGVGTCRDGSDTTWDMCQYGQWPVEEWT
eukprot:gene13076-19587_t